MATRHYLVPDYVLNFKCQRCTECCKHWLIYFDKNTVVKYEQLALQDKEFSDLLSESIKKNKDGGAFVQLRNGQRKGTTVLYGNQKKNISIEAAVCPFLDIDGLCIIQKKFGVEALSDTCKRFPRNIFLSERGLEMGLTYACATAADTLKNKNMVKFFQDPEDFAYPELNGQYCKIGDLQERKKAGKSLYFEVEELLINIMQTRDLDIDTRLVLIGIVIDKLKDSGIDDIRKYVQNLDDSLINQLKDVPSQPNIMMKLVKKLVRKSLSKGGISEQDMNKLLALYQGPIKTLDKITVPDEKVNKVLAGYNKYYKPYINDFSHVYENYFVNFIFSKKFYTHEYMDAYLLMIFFYTAIRFFTICTCLAERRKVDEDMVVGIIRAIERLIGHNNFYHKEALRQIKHGDYHSLPYVISLFTL